MIPSHLHTFRKFTIINYAPGSGGDFLANVISYSDKHTLPILQNDDMLIIEQVNGHYRVKGSTMYGKGFKQNPQLWNKLDLISKEMIIKSYTSPYVKGLSKNPNLYENSLLFGFEHWYTNNKEKIKYICNQPYWSAIDITPELPQSRKVLELYNSAINFLNKSKLEKFYNNRYDFIQHFPMMDYIVVKDYNSIKDWIEENYGSHLNFDYIDQKLKFWRKIRVEPYL